MASIFSSSPLLTPSPGRKSHSLARLSIGLLPLRAPLRSQPAVRGHSPPLPHVRSTLSQDSLSSTGRFRPSPSSLRVPPPSAPGPQSAVASILSFSPSCKPSRWSVSRPILRDPSLGSWFPSSLGSLLSTSLPLRRPSPWSVPRPLPSHPYPVYPPSVPHPHCCSVSVLREGRQGVKKA